ncbi:MAG: histidine triad nucleotide-binding protein [Clostridia bacterium]|nr:histidine triad nucleotide-binding protein [Clostridia bacterium]
MNDCLFCKIIKGEIPSTKVYEDDMVYAFRDIAPQAPHHVVIVPRIHLASANEITPENSKYVAKIFEVVPKIAKELGFDERGYRVVNNCGEDGLQSVKHLHFHLMGGRKFSWPAG